MIRRPRSLFRRMLAAAPFAIACVCLGPRGAEGALTSSEREQVRQFVATALPQNAAKVRAFVARTDLSSEEAFAAMRDALVPLPLTDARTIFLRDLLFGGASASARPALAPVVVRALLARADAVYVKAGADVEARADATTELWRIYAFLDEEVANAGRPRTPRHEPSAGIPDASYEECTKALAAHIAAHPAALKSHTPVGAPMARVRAQAQIALLELSNDSPTRRIDVADRLGLFAARKAMLTELGILLLDSAHADDTRVVRLRALLDRMPSARAGVEAIFVGDDRASLRARVAVLTLKSPLEGAATSSGALSWPEEIDPGSIDESIADLTLELATYAVRRAFENRSELRAQAEVDAKAAGGDARKAIGKPQNSSAEAAVAVAVALLATDATRVLELAAARMIAGRPESAALVSDAIGVLATSSAPGPANSGLSLQLGKVTGRTGATEAIPATNVRLAPNGSAVALQVSGRKWEIVRDESGRVTAMKRDGAQVTLSVLASARVPVSDATMWQEGKIVFARLQGTPRAGLAPGPRIRVVGMSSKGFDSIATPSPGPDVVVEADVRIDKDLGGLVVRALSDRDAFRGVSLLLAPSIPPRALLLSSDGTGNEVELAPGIDLPQRDTFHVKITVRGTAIEAVVAGTPLKGTIPALLAGGDVAVRAKKGATVEVTGFTVTRLK